MFQISNQNTDLQNRVKSVEPDRVAEALSLIAKGNDWDGPLRRALKLLEVGENCGTRRIDRVDIRRSEVRAAAMMLASAFLLVESSIDILLTPDGEHLVPPVPELRTGPVLR